MKLQDLKDAVNSIEIDESMQEEILQNVSERVKANNNSSTQRKANRKRITRFPRAAATAAGILLAVGIVGIPVRAVVSSLVQERMEEIPAQEHQEMVEMLDSQEVGADTYSREYTAKERSRMGELYSQYQQGEFPEGELLQVDNAEEAEAMELCYLTTNSTFYLPDRELTDEELLQLIDFEVKRNYALRQRYEEEFAEEIAAKEQKQKEQIVDEGGITEEEAIVEAQKWLEKIYGITEEGLELNHYVWDDDPFSEDEDKPAELYMVNWTDMPNRQYYYFLIKAHGGSLWQAMYSSGAMVDAIQTDITPDELQGKLPGLKEKALSFMADKLGDDVKNYTESYLNYYVYDGKTTGSGVDFVFVDESGAGCVIQYIWDGTFSAYNRTNDIEEYQQGREQLAEARTKDAARNGESLQIEQVIMELDEL